MSALIPLIQSVFILLQCKPNKLDTDPQSLTRRRQLYYILGDIITQLYGSNVDSDPNLSIPTLLERTLSLEQRLSAWRRNLFPQLQRRPWDTLDPDSVWASAWDPVFDRLSVIITLRYLNTRILLHRPMLSAFLRKRACYRSLGVQSDEEDPYFQDLAEKSLKICAQSAMEIVQIVHKTSAPPTLLGAWWFSTYYSKMCCLLLVLVRHYIPNPPL